MNSNGEFEEVTIVSQSNMNSNLGSFNSQEKLDVKASEGKKLNEEQIANLLKSYNEEIVLKYIAALKKEIVFLLINQTIYKMKKIKIIKMIFIKVEI